MKVGILCAGDTEVAPFLPMIEGCRKSEKAMLKFYSGTIEGVEIVTLYSGVCKVNAAIAAQILIDSFGCDRIINAGTAGGMDPSLHIFDTVIGTEMAYHDVAEDILTDFHPWLESVYFRADKELLSAAREVAAQRSGQAARRSDQAAQRSNRALSEPAPGESAKDGEEVRGRRVVFGRMVTGEAFITDENRDEINAVFGPLTVDMETVAVAHVCYVNKIPFLAVRTLTDTPDHRGIDAFEENCEIASGISAEFVRELLKRQGKN